MARKVFPSSPNVNDIFTSTKGKKFLWNGKVWKRTQDTNVESMTLDSSADEKLALHGSDNPTVRFREGSTDKGNLHWKASTGEMRLVNEESSQELRLGSSGVTVTGNLDVTGNLEVTGTTTFNGGTLTLGDSATDNVVFGADVNSSIIPNTDDLYDLGSASKQWRSLYIDGTANIDSLVADTADITGGITGALTGDVTGNSDTATTLETSRTLSISGAGTGSASFNGGANADIALTLANSGVTAATYGSSSAIPSITVDAKGLITSASTTAIDSTSISNGSASVAVASNGPITATGNLDVTAGVDVTGNITVSGTVDGRDVASDGSKLDGIEASADVTDATNVNAAGAVMNSDTSTGSMSFVVDEDNMSSNSATKVPTQQSVKTYVDTEVAGVIDSAPGALNTLNELAAALGDDASFSTTVTNSIATKLPKSGGQMTGNITFSGSQTVDGRDLSSDGSKLDGIESGATADQTAAEIRSLVESASDSNVFTDADHSKLNGIAASATNVTNNNQITNGAGYITGFDITTQTDSKYLRSNTADTASGDITFSGGAGAVSIAGGSDIRFTAGNWTGEHAGKIQYHSNHMYIQYNSNVYFRNSGGSNVGNIDNSGNLGVSGQVTASSDVRLKKNITTIDNALDKVLNLRGVEFDYKENDVHSIGVIAQEVEEVLPDLVRTDEEDNFKSVAYGNLTAVLIEAVKELTAEVNTLKAELNTIKGK